ncbi:TRAP transporter large permease [Youngiibacter multivorans]|uniref:Tripartite ATP-independent transporter DctM subunit n=1 Tax=Youngiibacter multivorans TaxID=937251 RepID=A0ABS4G538_9CLOT|nr:TRAP transporter large permease [Youngiibacter multivorans]MBP1919415.1 tripartite ATP-independent transporter DctM subunit [Youngiibacter multivorans]
MSIFLISLFFILMFLGIPVAVSLGFSSVLTLALFSDIPLTLISQSMFSSMNSFIMVAVPLFILAGNIMDKGGVGDKIFNFANSMVGWMPGGLGHVNIVTSLIFAGMSGSSVADVAGLGVLEMSAMEKHGYDKEYSAAITVATSTLATMIPPSILMIVAASVANVSVGKALVGGVIPGILIAVVFMVYNHLYCKKHKIGDRSKFSLEIFFKSLLISIPAMLVPVIILIGMFTGIVTPTEAAAIAVVYSTIISLTIYKGFTLKNIPRLLINTTKTTGTILFIAVTAKSANWIFEFDGLPAKIATSITSLTSNPVLIMLVVLVFLVVVGMIMDATAAIYIVVPILLPAVTSVGVDPLFFVVFLVLSLALGLITPPVGVCLYAATSVTGLRLEQIVPKLMPWIIILIMSLAILAVFPGIIMGPLNFLFPI